MSRREISEKLILKLPPRVLEKNKDMGGNKSKRVNQLLLRALDFGAEIGIKRTGNRLLISDCPGDIRPFLDAWWQSEIGGFGAVDGDNYLLLK